MKNVYDQLHIQFKVHKTSFGQPKFKKQIGLSTETSNAGQYQGKETVQLIIAVYSQLVEFQNVGLR